VIVAHASAIALADNERALRVLVTASPETRAARLEEANQLEKAEAERLVERSDRERAAYFKRFYGIAAESPTDYDLVLNTDRLSPAHAVALICEAANAIAG
jgi:cytidylate kinase